MKYQKERDIKTACNVSNRHSFGHMETLALIISAIEEKCFNVWHGLIDIICLGTVSDWFWEEQHMEILAKVLCKQTLQKSPAAVFLLIRTWDVYNSPDLYIIFSVLFAL